MKRGAFTVVAAVVAVLIIVGGVQSWTGKSASANTDDAGVTAVVKTRIVADGTVNLTRIDVDTNRGTVYLNGSVDTVEQKARAERLARQPSGVKGVVNNLQIHKKR